MSYEFDVSSELKEKLKILAKKNKLLYERVLKKINEIVNCFDVECYKNLKQ